MNDDATQVIAIDLGGTSVRAALVQPDGSVQRRLKSPSQPKHAAQQIVSMIRSLRQDSRATAVVVGLPGRVDRHTGTLEIARNLPEANMPGLSAAELGAAAGLSVHLCGDAELAAIGETYFGAGEIHGTTAFLTLSTGVGSAAVADGRLLAGRLAGFQIGFLQLLGPDRPIVDALASGQRVQLLATEIGRPIPDVQTLLDLVAEGHLEATAAWAEMLDAAVAAALLLCHVCSPDVLVVGGGIAHGAGDRLLGPLRHRIDGEYTAVVGHHVAIRAAALGDDAGLAGAAAWSRAVCSSSPAVLEGGHR